MPQEARLTAFDRPSSCPGNRLRHRPWVAGRMICISIRRPFEAICRAPELTMNLTPIYAPLERPKPHPICLLMPSADEDELRGLTDDIRAHGLLDPIVLFERRILDGRNRAAACESSGREPHYVEFEGTREEALMFVVSHNLKRRHLTKQAIADTLVEAEDFNLHDELGEPAAQSDIKMSAQSKKLRRAVN